MNSNNDNRVKVVNREYLIGSSSMEVPAVDSCQSAGKTSNDSHRDQGRSHDCEVYDGGRSGKKSWMRGGSPNSIVVPVLFFDEWGHWGDTSSRSLVDTLLLLHHCLHRHHHDYVTYV